MMDAHLFVHPVVKGYRNGTFGNRQIYKMGTFPLNEFPWILALCTPKPDFFLEHLPVNFCVLDDWIRVMIFLINKAISS